MSPCNVEGNYNPWYLLPMQYDINSIYELVDTLGGDTKVASWLGISQSAVSQWKLRGQIATGWHIRLLAELTRRGKTINPAVFGLTSDDLAPLLGKTATSEVAAVA